MKWEEIDELSRRSLKRLIEVVAEEEKGKEGRIVEKIVEEMLESGNVAAEKERRGCYDYRKGFRAIHRAGLRRQLWRVSAVACVLCLALGGFWQFIRTQEEMKPMEILPRKGQVVLKLSDGKTVALNGEKHVNLQEGRREIQAGNNTVDYTVGISDADSGELRYNVLSIPNGGEYSVILSDGTRVYLNAASELRYPVAFVGEVREVYLKGEAYFDVAKDAVHPFVVKVEGMDVKVLGTRFNINTCRVDGVYETTLLEGKVTVSDGKDLDVTLKPDEQLRMKDGKFKVCKVDARQYIAWVNGKFYFVKESLEEIAAQLERWYDVQFFFTRDTLKQEKFTGVVLRDYTVEEILAIIEKTTNVRFVVNGSTITVR